MTLALWDCPHLHWSRVCRGSGSFGTRCGAGRCAAASWPSQATTTLNLNLGPSHSPDLRGSLPGEMTCRRSQKKNSKKAGVQEPIQTANFSYTETKRKPESCSCGNPGPPRSKRKAHQNYRELSLAAGSRQCTNNKYCRRPGEQGALQAAGGMQLTTATIGSACRLL